MKNIIYILLLLLTLNFSFAQQPAFPTAYGAGSYSTGGRGYPVYTVTTLVYSASGGLSEALTNAKAGGGGNIVFNVSGTIQYTGSFVWQDLTNISILGQTAPQGGITLTNTDSCSSCRAQFIYGDNLIIRYIKFRPNYTEGAYDALEFISCNNIIIDHCSLNWGSDEGISTRVFSSVPVYNITFQRLLLAECKTGNLMGYSVDTSLGYDQSTHKNLFVNVDHRFPNASTNGRMDIINNVIYDWYARLSVFNGNASINNIGNSYYLGRKSSLNMADNGSGHELMCILEGNTGANMSVYSSDTFIDGNYPAAGLGEEDLFYIRGPADSYGNTVKADTTIQVGTQFSLLGNDVPILSASANFTDVLADVGANAYIDNNGIVQRESDSLDLFYMDLVTANPQVLVYARAPSDNYNGFPVSSGDYLFRYYDRYIDFHNSVTTTPINTRPVGYDTDNDGMPDVWETATFGDLTKTGTADTNGDGYTDLERFLNLVDGTPSGNVTHPLTELQKGKGRKSIRKLVKINN